MYDDAKLIIDLFATIKDKLAGSIVHTYHGVNYSSKFYQEMLKKCHATKSLSCIANSLGNHDWEFWCNIPKTELIYRLDIKQKLFAQLKEIIANYIYYNNVQIQKKIRLDEPNLN